MFSATGQSDKVSGEIQTGSSDKNRLYYVPDTTVFQGQHECLHSFVISSAVSYLRSFSRDGLEALKIETETLTLPAEMRLTRDCGYFSRCDRHVKVHIVLITVVQLGTAALHAMQSAVIPTAIPSVRLSHALVPSRRMKIGSRGLHCEVAKTL